MDSNPFASGGAARGDSAQSEMMTGLIPLVNKIQQAFAVGHAQKIDLPQIAVVGGQSSGKSSVLEAIVGKSFLPRGTGIVTRRPLVLQLHQAARERAEFLHSPGAEFTDFEQIRQEIEDETARKCGRNLGVHPEPIVLSVYSPDVLDLTLIDLPGTTKVPVGDQPADIEQQIRSMILGFIRREECIVLAVTAANTDLANSDAIALARAVDPAGERTIGVLTKVDLMDRGTSAREALLNGGGGGIGGGGYGEGGATGGETLPRLRLGYYGVVNRAQQDIRERKTIKDALAAERTFFETHPDYADCAHRVTCPMLARSCSQLLKQHIRRALPRIANELETVMFKTQRELMELPEDMSDDSAKQRKLTELLMKVSSCYEQIIEGGQKDVRTMDKLRGGARIEYIFVKQLPNDLKRVRPETNHKMEDVMKLVFNTRGIGGGMYDMDDAMKTLVRMGVENFEAPAVQCVRRVYAELVSFATEAIDHVPGLQAFPVFCEKLREKLLALLSLRQDDAVKFVKKQIAMELARVNLKHPDFIGQHIKSRAETRAMARDAAAADGAGAAAIAAPTAVASSNPFAPAAGAPPAIPAMEGILKKRMEHRAQGVQPWERFFFRLNPYDQTLVWEAADPRQRAGGKPAEPPLSLAQAIVEPDNNSSGVPNALVVTATAPSASGEMRTLWLVGDYEDAATCRQWIDALRRVAQADPANLPTPPPRAALPPPAAPLSSRAPSMPLGEAGGFTDDGDGADGPDEDFVVLMKMVESYFEIVRKTIGDTVPKSVMINLVSPPGVQLAQDLLNHKDFTDKANISYLMESDPLVREKRERLKATLEKLQAAQMEMDKINKEAAFG